MKTLDSYPDQVKQRLEYFLQNSDLARVSRSVRKLFFGYLRDSQEGLSIDFDSILYDVEGIIDLCESISDSIASKNQ